MRELLLRYFRSYWRSPPYNTTRLILAAIAGVIIGSYYWSLGDKIGTLGDVNNILGACALRWTLIMADRSCSALPVAARRACCFDSS